VTINSNNGKLEIRLYEAEHIDGKYIALAFRYDDILYSNISNGTIDLTHKEVIFWRGDHFLKEDEHACNMKDISFEISKVQNEAFYPLFERKISSATVQLKATGNTCPISFQTTLMKSYDEKLEIQTWVYLALYLIWCIPNIIYSAKKLRNFINLDLIEVLQFFFLYHINFKLSTWNTLVFRKCFGGGVTSIISILDFLIWFPNLSITILNIPRIHNRFIVMSIFPLNGLLMMIIFYFDSEPLLMMFSAISLLDIAKYIRRYNGFKFNFTIYISILIPGLLIMGYLTLYSGNALRLTARPKYIPYFITYFGLTFVVLPLQMTILDLKQRFKRNKRYANLRDINSEEICPICAQPFVETEEKKESLDLEIGTENQKDSENIELTKKTSAKLAQQKILKTECKHLFHEKCLRDWMKIKLQCPTCRAEITNLF